jgi:hypothetical protein
MTGDPDFRTQADFAAARTKAVFRQIVALLTGRPNQLLAYDQVREKLRLGGPIYRGVQTVLLHKIVGSVDRYEDFDRAFLPTQTHTADRWRRVSRPWWERGISACGMSPCSAYAPGWRCPLTCPLGRLSSKTWQLRRISSTPSR